MTFYRQLIVLHITPSMFGKFWCMLRGSRVEASTKNIPYWFIEGQTHFGMTGSTKRSLASMYRYGMFSIQSQALPPSIHE